MSARVRSGRRRLSRVLSLCALLVGTGGLVACASSGAPSGEPATGDLAPDEPPAAPRELEGARDARVLEAFPAPTQAFLRFGPDLEILALVCERQAAPGEETVGDYPIVGRAIAKGPARDEVLEALFRGVLEGRSVAMCFEPHHAVRARTAERTVSIVICFECHQLYVEDGRPEPGWAAISAAALPVLERLLGPDRPRDTQAVAGRALHEWLEHFWTREYQPTLDPGERSAVAALGEALSWAGPMFAENVAGALARLGPAASPALPGLRRALGSAPPFEVGQAISLLRALGPAGAPAAAEVAQAYDRDYTPYVLDPDETDEDAGDRPSRVDSSVVDDLRAEALEALIAFGAGAHAARPLAERLSRSEEVGAAEAGRRILANLDSAPPASPR